MLTVLVFCAVKQSLAHDPTIYQFQSQMVDGQTRGMVKA
jgi:hypothetical protein